MATIRELRRAADMTQAELAAEIGRSQKDVSRWEKGQVKPGVDALRALAKVFGVPMESISTPRLLTTREVLTSEGYDSTTPAERRAIVKGEQVKEYSKWGRYPTTYQRLAERLPSEWWAIYSAEHLADIIDLLERAYSDGISAGKAKQED